MGQVVENGINLVYQLLDQEDGTSGHKRGMVKQMGTLKYQQIFEELKTDILSGRYRWGQKLPSEAALMKRAGVSRITVVRALRELQHAGLVERIAGSGTFARDSASLETRAFLFGLLIPELGTTEIFAPICRAIASAPAAKLHALLWGNAGAASTSKQALSLLEQFISRSVDGVFFAPLEFGADADRINHRILRQLRKAQIATVLLDRRVSRLSSRDRADITGINHRHAAYMATEHLLTTGCRKLCFVTSRSASSSVTDRHAGFQQAIADSGFATASTAHFDLETDTTALRRWVRFGKPLGTVCVNDQVAGRVLHLAMLWKLIVPDDLRLTGIDDVGYASILPVPLTTVKQPIEQIGQTALQLMLERIYSPDRPTREVLLDGELIVRESSVLHPTASHIGQRTEDRIQR
jgi:GntR family transcriptional regulator, arabinose operon transcriptional repressor